MIEVDIESKKIVKGAPLLPVPVGIALGVPQPDGTTQRVYLAWGHPSGNNCTFEQAKAVMEKYWHEEWLTHNGCIFDVPNLTHHFGLPDRDPLLTHDTLFAAYLYNPHARSLSLKDLANDWLGIPPDEQQEMYDWILTNVADCTARSQCGAYISETPVSLSGPYAIGDIHRTKELWDFLQPSIALMQEPYDRERRLAPVLARMQNGGVRVDEIRLKEDCHKANIKKALLDQLIREHLKAGPSFNPGSDKELGAKLVELGYEGFFTTPTGKLSMARPSLECALENDPVLKDLIRCRSLYDTLIGTFMEPWLRYCASNDGRIHPGYNQVRNPDGYGTRTGRLSSSDPNGQNIPKNQGLDYWGDPYPDMRSYLLPEVGQVWFCGDFKSQEPRLTAHFEGGTLMQAYIDDPLLDVYLYIQKLIGGDITRHECKQIFLGLVYAMGVAALAGKIGNGCSESRALNLRNIIKANMQDVVELDRECKKRFQSGLPICTLGGRLYYCEPPNGGRQWDYKALNTLVQGSAADQNKEAMLYLDPKIVDIHGRLLSTVHDEISCSVFEKDVVYVEEIYQEAANYLKCDVPMIMDTAYGDSWATGKPA